MSIFNHFKQLNLSQRQRTALAMLKAFLDSQVQGFVLNDYARHLNTTENDPIQNQCYSKVFRSDIKTVLLIFKQGEYAS